MVLVSLAVLPMVVSLFSPSIGSLLFGLIGILGYLACLLGSVLLLMLEPGARRGAGSTMQYMTRVAAIASEAPFVSYSQELAKTKTIAILTVVLFLTWTPVIVTAILTFLVSNVVTVSIETRIIISAC